MQRTIEQKKRHAEYMREYYKAHPEKRSAWKRWFKKYRNENRAYHKKFRQKYIDKLKVRRVELKKVYAEAKDHPCVDCGRKYNQWVMQFDHRDPETKLADVSRLIATGKDIQVVKDEIAKCDLVCANCHAERSYIRFKTGY